MGITRHGMQNLQGQVRNLMQACEDLSSTLETFNGTIEDVLEGMLPG